MVSRSPQETFQRGFEFAGTLKPGDVVSFTGPLGSGKTQFIKGICSGLGAGDYVNSPTFMIVNEYEGHYKGEHLKICHFDLYRIKDSRELEEIGIEDYLSGNSICLVEWGELADGKIPFTGSVKLGYGALENERTIIS